MTDQPKPVNITTEMKNCYLDYAMSVIIGRALPDVRDGLKPVHRRILYAMRELGLYPNRQFRKSVRIVGDVLGKYHPHGDASVYDALVRMAQDFNMRYTTVLGHGNFGSIDGDSAAAMRYTEAKLDKIAMEMLRDINRDTVDFVDNFDGNESEPEVLPARFPHLLVNGSQGIAVGMATNIPTHNLGEVIDACVAYIDNPDITVDELMEYLPGPDFPTGGIIMGRDGIEKAYRTGRGKILIRGRTEFDTDRRGRDQIIITEIPYNVKKTKIIEQIVQQAERKLIVGVSDVRDESDLKNGIRIVVDIKHDANPNVVLNQIIKHTELQTSFGIIFLALVKDQNGGSKPEILSLKRILKEYVDFQKSVIERRTRFDLNKAEARAHILEGLVKALDNIDEIIQIVRGSDNGPIAKAALMDRFGFTDEQAQAILDMRLQRLTGLERANLEEELEALHTEINRLKSILSDPSLLLGIIKEELLEVKENYSDERRTSFAEPAKNFRREELIEESEIVVTISQDGFTKRTPLSAFGVQKRGGKGRIGAHQGKAFVDPVEHLYTMSSHHYLLFFTNTGQVYSTMGLDLPEKDRTAKGQRLNTIINFNPHERVTAILPIKDFDEDKSLIMLTKYGFIKRMNLEQIRNLKNRDKGLRAVKLEEGDELVAVFLGSETDELIIGTHEGFAIRFSLESIAETGRTARGVGAINLKKDDYIVGADLIDTQGYGKLVLTITENGYGKLTKVSDYRLQNRRGKGSKAYRVTERTGKPVKYFTCNEEDEFLLMSSDMKVIHVKVADFSVKGRVTQGVKVMDLDEGGKIVSVTKVFKLMGSTEEDEKLLEAEQALEELEDTEDELDIIEDEQYIESPEEY